MYSSSFDLGRLSHARVGRSAWLGRRTNLCDHPCRRPTQRTLMHLTTTMGMILKGVRRRMRRDEKPVGRRRCTENISRGWTSLFIKKTPSECLDQTQPGALLNRIPWQWQPPLGSLQGTCPEKRVPGLLPDYQETYIVQHDLCESSYLQSIGPSITCDFRNVLNGRNTLLPERSWTTSSLCSPMLSHITRTIRRSGKTPWSCRYVGLT